MLQNRIRCLATIASFTFVVVTPNPLVLFRESPQLLFYCAVSQDNDVSMHDLAHHLETFFIELSQKFNHTYVNPISVTVYPALTDFHNAINAPGSPAWIIGQAEKDSIMGVSPANPGPYHTYASVVCAYKVSLATLFVEDMYKHHALIPHWLHMGVSLYVSQFFNSVKNREKLAKNVTNLPNLEQLDTIPKYDTVSFDYYHGFNMSYSIVEFIYRYWGWDTVLKLLNNYEMFGDVMGVSKQEFILQWTQSLFIDNY